MSKFFQPHNLGRMIMMMMIIIIVILMIKLIKTAILMVAYLIIAAPVSLAHCIPNQLY